MDIGFSNFNKSDENEYLDPQNVVPDVLPKRPILKTPSRIDPNDEESVKLAQLRMAKKTSVSKPAVDKRLNSLGSQQSEIYPNDDGTFENLPQPIMRRSLQRASNKNHRASRRIGNDITKQNAKSLITILEANIETHLRYDADDYYIRKLEVTAKTTNQLSELIHDILTQVGESHELLIYELASKLNINILLIFGEEMEDEDYSDSPFSYENYKFLTSNENISITKIDQISSDKIFVVAFDEITTCYFYPKFLNYFEREVNLKNYNLQLKQVIQEEFNISEIDDEFLKQQFNNTENNPNIVKREKQDIIPVEVTEPTWLKTGKQITKWLSVVFLFFGVLATILFNKLLLIQFVYDAKYKNWGKSEDGFNVFNLINYGYILSSEVISCLHCSYIVWFKTDEKEFDPILFLKGLVPEILDCIGQFLFVWIVIPNLPEAITLCVMSCCYIIPGLLSSINWEKFDCRSCWQATFNFLGAMLQIVMLAILLVYISFFISKAAAVMVRVEFLTFLGASWLIFQV